MLTCAMSWESFSHGFAPALSSPLRKTAQYGRPVHRLGGRAGRSPGSRVVAQLRPAFPVSQWPCGRGLAAHSCGGSHGMLRPCSIRVPSFVPGATRGTSTLKCSLERAAESSGVGHVLAHDLFPKTGVHFSGSCAGPTCSAHVLPALKPVVQPAVLLLAGCFTCLTCFTCFTYFFTYLTCLTCFTCFT